MIEFDRTILFQFVNLLIVLILLNFLLFKPILNALKKRQASLRALSEKAEGSRAEAEELERNYEDSLKERRLPVVEGRDAGLKEAQGASMKVIEEARRELTEELAKVKDAVKKEAARTLEALKTESDRLSSEIVEKLVKRGA